MKLITNENLMIVNMEASDKEHVIRALGSKLLEQDYVTDEFIEAVLDREKVFPTGLPLGIPVAIPHTDPSYCKQNALAVATLLETVPFYEMGDSENKLDVSMVFLLSIKEPEQQVHWLQKLVMAFKDEGSLEELRNSKDCRTLAESIKRILDKE